MTTLNARADQAWRDYDPDADMSGSERFAFKEGWETGYKAACREQDLRLDRVEAAAYDRGWNDAKEAGL